MRGFLCMMLSPLFLLQRSMFYFNPHTDAFCLFLENHLFGNPVKLELIDRIKTLSVEDIRAISPQGETRLLYLIRRLLACDKLDASIDLIELLFWRSKQFPLAFNTTQFLLWYPDNVSNHAYNLSMFLNSQDLNFLLKFETEQLAHQRVSRSFKSVLAQAIEQGDDALLLTQLHVSQQMLQSRQITFETYKQEILGTEIDRRSIFSDHNPVLTQYYIQRARYAFERKYLPYSEAETLFQTQNYHGCRLLDTVLYPGGPVHGFAMIFDFLCEAVSKGWISEPTYAQILTKPVDDRRSLLHELIMHGDVNHYMRYLYTLDTLYKRGQVTEDAYLAIFAQKNNNGYSAVHQSLNAPNMAISVAFWAWFKRNDVLLSNNSRHALLCLRAEKNGNYPKRISDNWIMNDEVGALRQALCSPRLSVFVELAKVNSFPSVNSTVLSSPDDVRATGTMSPGGI
jgi:hypothetical protein